MSTLKSPRFLPFLTRSQINVLVARRIHHKDHFMIPKVLYGLYLIQNLDTNDLLLKNKQREKLEIKKGKIKKKKKKKEKKRFSHSHNTKRTEYRRADVSSKGMDSHCCSESLNV